MKALVEVVYNEEAAPEAKAEALVILGSEEQIARRFVKKLAKKIEGWECP